MADYRPSSDLRSIRDYRRKMMGWMAPGRHLSAKLVSSKIISEGAIHERDYNNRVGLGEERLPGPWS
jgi:hypothetical protein